MSETILIIEDEPKVARLARDYLEKNGYRVLVANDGDNGLAMARREKPDLLVLDLMLPGMDGLDVCRALRRESDLPIIMLTARAEETDRLIGLEIGADDYISKPFSPRELVARVRALLRRAKGRVYVSGIIRVGELELNTDNHSVVLAGESIHLTRIEFNLLETMARHPGQIFPRAQLLENLHGVAYIGYDRSIDAHIKNLRRKIEEDPANPKYILTVYAIGYKFSDEHR
ncbi:MAG: response regulator transcription factor [Anaerolineae bacterium]|jgi:two-component system, OmpR family, alkaline phosphatase synthesis response regulator PhoP|nr:response regulator transcription factor [Anaerolineae bacterium]MBT7190719.1 response regulator transcription factor [Anaerolineae bacterium]MBT7989707.1 response regulator transcription factor [Anaerolineae bacterium]